MLKQRIRSAPSKYLSTADSSRSQRMWCSQLHPHHATVFNQEIIHTRPTHQHQRLRQSNAASPRRRHLCHIGLGAHDGVAFEVFNILNMIPDASAARPINRRGHQFTNDLTFGQTTNGGIAAHASNPTLTMVSSHGARPYSKLERMHEQLEPRVSTTDTMTS